MKKSKKLPKILLARELRKEQTETEKILWQYLRDRKFQGKKFRRQHVISGFIADFYCPEEKLVIELDGSVHLTQKEYDNERQKIIEDLGIKVLRFKNKDVQCKIKKVLLTIKNNLNPSPSMMEKGAKDHLSLNRNSG